jgi:TonB family protein
MLRSGTKYWPYAINCRVKIVVSFILIINMNRRLSLALLACMPFATPVTAQTVAPVLDQTRCEKARYPVPEQAAGHTGQAVVRVLIGENGQVRESAIKSSSGYPALDLAAQEALERCVFHAGTGEGKAVADWVEIPYGWHLDTPSPEQVQQQLVQWQAGAERGEAQSRFELGKAIFDGHGIEHDPELGKQLLQLAADQGLASAQERLADILLSESRENKRAGQEAVKWLHKAAVQNNPRAQLGLAMLMIEAGQHDAGNAWLERAVANNYSHALAYRGAGLLDSDAPGDIQRGIKLLTKAVELGAPLAGYDLGTAYADGRGVARDDRRAAKLYSEAAANGSKLAKVALAQFYEAGQGVLQLPERARRLRQEASADPVSGAAPVPVSAADKAFPLWYTCNFPRWPRAALRKEQQGAVKLAFLIDEDGVVRDTKIRESSGHALLDEAAINAVKRCLFTPYAEQGKLTPTWTNMEYRWKIES